MKNIECSCCGRILLTEVPEDTKEGIIAYQLRKLGYFPKNPIFYTGISAWYWFCSLECQFKYYYETLKITPEQVARVKPHMDEIRKKIPTMARETTTVVQSLINYLKPKR